MKGFYWGSGVVRCSFCGNTGHNITTCPTVNYHASCALQKMENNSSYVCSTHEHVALMEIKNRETRKAKKRKPRKPSRCSYCKELHHKRPSCPHLKDFRSLVYTANKNWKRLFTQKANEVGIGIGSLVQFSPEVVENLDFSIGDSRITMLSKYDFRNLNVFCSLGSYSDYQSDAYVQILSGDKTDNISVKHLSHLVGDDLLYRGWWYANSLPVVLSPMSFVPDEEWFGEEWNEVLNWFFKRVNRFDLENTGLMKFIEEWAEKV